MTSMLAWLFSVHAPAASTRRNLYSLGNSDGAFQTHVDYQARGGPTSLAAADFDGDGGPDLAVTNEIGSTPRPKSVGVF
jgi:hypothetical protein